MKRIKCEACGANLKIDEKKHYAMCEYCNSTYKIDENLNIEKELTEEERKKIEETFQKNGKLIAGVMFASSIPFFLIMLVIVLFVAFRIKVSNFNGHLTMNEGITSAFFIKDDLGYIASTNEKNKRIITVIYQDEEYVTADEILELEKKFKAFEDYYVTFTKDKLGYITEYKIKVA